MSCEFINTPICPTVEAVSTLKSELGKAAEGFTAIELRELVCKNDNDETRKKDCPTFRTRKRL